MAMRYWTAEEDEWLRQNYSYENIMACAEHLGRTRQAVMARASKLKISSGRFFTKEEREFFEKRPDLSNDALAKRFGRSYESIKHHRSIFFVTTIDGNHDKLTCAEIARLLNVPRADVTKTWCKQGLKYRKVGKYKMVTHENLFEFMQQHPEKWDATQCETWFFEKYPWFQEKHKQDFEKMVGRRLGR